MRQPPKPTSIAEEGLQPYLDRTADQHGNIDYAKFVEHYDNPKITNVALADLMGYNNTTTLYKLIALLEKGRENGKA